MTSWSHGEGSKGKPPVCLRESPAQPGRTRPPGLQPEGLPSNPHRTPAAAGAEGVPGGALRPGAEGGRPCSLASGRTPALLPTPQGSAGSLLSGARLDTNAGFGKVRFGERLREAATYSYGISRFCESPRRCGRNKEIATRPQGLKPHTGLRDVLWRL